MLVGSKTDLWPGRGHPHRPQAAGHGEQQLRRAPGVSRAPLTPSASPRPTAACSARPAPRTARRWRRCCIWLGEEPRLPRVGLTHHSGPAGRRGGRSAPASARGRTSSPQGRLGAAAGRAAPAGPAPAVPQRGSPRRAGPAAITPPPPSGPGCAPARSAPRRPASFPEPPGSPPRPGAFGPQPPR